MLSLLYAKHFGSELKSAKKEKSKDMCIVCSRSSRRTLVKMGLYRDDTLNICGISERPHS